MGREILFSGTKEELKSMSSLILYKFIKSEVADRIYFWDYRIERYRAISIGVSLESAILLS